MGTNMTGTPHNRHVLSEEAVAESSLAYASQSFVDDGFSVLELDRAGISESRAHSLGLPIDGTRHSALRHNVRHLKSVAG
jgi:ribosomal protein L13E